MAKYCDVCKQPYADDLASCPHCAATGATGAKDTPATAAGLPSPAPADSGIVIYAAGASASEFEVTEGSSADLDLGGKESQKPADSGIVVPGDAAAPASPFDAVEGSSADLDMSSQPPAKPEDSAAAQLAAKGPPSDVVEVDWSAMADELTPGPSRRAEQPPVVGAADERLIEIVEDAEAPSTAPAPAAEETAKAPPAEPSKPTQLAPRSRPETMLAKPEDQALEAAATDRVEPAAVTGDAEAEMAAMLAETPAEGAPAGVDAQAKAPAAVGEGEEAAAESDSSAWTEEETAPAVEREVGAGAEEELETPARGKGWATPWIGGGAIGVVLGVAACAILYLGGLVPGSSSKKAGTGSPGVAAPAGPKAQTQHQPGAAVLAANDRLAKLLEKFPLKAKDPEVEAAEKEWANSKNPDDVFRLGVLQESLGQTAQARKTFQQGLQQFQERRFQAGLDRLDTLMERQGPAEKSGGNQPAGAQPKGHEQARGFAAPWAVLFLPALMADPPPPAKNDQDEAGFEFWNALKLARQQHYDQAIAALQKARAVHEQQRFRRYGKPQNPNSDPTEEIFLRCTDQLKDYWEIRARLAAEGYLAKQPNPVRALEALVNDKKNAVRQNPAALAEKLKDRLKIDKDVKRVDPALTDIAKDLDVVLAAKKDAQARLEAIQNLLAFAKVLGEKQKDEVAGVNQLFKEKKYASDALALARNLLKPGHYISEDSPSVAGGIEKLLAAKKATTEELAKATAKLQSDERLLTALADQLAKAKVLPEGAGQGQLLTGLDRLIKESTSPLVTVLAKIPSVCSEFAAAVAGRLGGGIDLGARLTAIEVQATRYRIALAESRTPEQMLDIWVRLLHDQRSAGMVGEAAQDAQRVLRNPAATPEARSEARCVAGLALRGQGKFVAARRALGEALKQAGAAPKEDWQATAREVLRELTDPGAYVLPVARQLLAYGRPDAALEMLNRALEVFPASTKAGGRLLALRSLVRLALAAAQSGGRPPTPASLKSAQQDARAALDAGAVADGHAALGRLAEALGQWSKAEDEYRQALLPAQLDKQTANRYRLGLARAILRGVEGLKPPARDKKLAQAKKLAEQAIKGGDAAGHLVLARVLVREDQWTAGLMEYLTGMEQTTRPPGIVAGLHELVVHHPAFRIPDSLQPPRPLAAEENYVRGLRLYWARKYPEAEKNFAAAIRNSDQDARYFYFLGLARLRQNDRAGAIEAFRRGGLLEKQDKPDSGTINLALERIQGPGRRLIDQARR